LAEAIFWTTLAAYAAAAAAYVGAVRSPGRLGRLGTWAVRIGWLLQTALLGLQTSDAGGFPWVTWSASLNLFVWFVVGTYLIWGCRTRCRLLGIAVMPLAAVLLAVAYAGGGTSESGTRRYSDLFLVLHVGLVLIAFAGFTLAAALSALYLWQERRLKRREAGILRLRAPSLVNLDALVGRTIAVALPALTFGIAAGLVRLVGHGGRFDVLMAVTLVMWAVYCAFLLLRYEAGWHGRKAAYLALAGFALVIAVRLGLPAAHFS
jgi:ABC-type uncharacterized transport system permease subunit